MNQDPGQPAAPPSGSYRYFAWLYTPAALRNELNTLLALADEVGAQTSNASDHNVAHVRLEWWRYEMQRFASGQPQHPWLRAMLAHYPRSIRLNLHSLVDAAAIDLAQTSRAEAAAALPGALFALLADALGDEPLSSALTQAVSELGVAAQQFEHAPPASSARASAQHSLRAIDAAAQRRLRPLLVWLALAAQHSPAGSPLLHGLRDNLIAWKAARRCARGQFTLK